MKDNKNNKANFDVIQKHSIFARKERMETSPHSLLQFVKKNEFIRITGGTLPHWHQTGKVQFVTFRLADSLPKAKLEEWKTLKTQWLEAHPKPWDDNAKREYSLFFGEKKEGWLDAGHGSCILQYEDVRKIVFDALLFFHGRRYVLHHFVVMPNHVHLLATPIGEDTVTRSLGSVKRFTSIAINRMLGRSGAVWQRLVFDRLVRGWKDYERYVNYIKSNPQALPPNTYSLWSLIDNPTEKDNSE